MNLPETWLCPHSLLTFLLLKTHQELSSTHMAKPNFPNLAFESNLQLPELLGLLSAQLLRHSQAV